MARTDWIEAHNYLPPISRGRYRTKLSRWMTVSAAA